MTAITASGMPFRIAMLPRIPARTNLPAQTRRDEPFVHRATRDRLLLPGPRPVARTDPIE